MAYFQRKRSKIAEKYHTSKDIRPVVEVPPILPTKKVLKWWEKPPIKYAFSHPQIRSKLEKLMGSDLVSLTDRNYMIYLQQRILQDYVNSVAKRILVRQAEEMERVKNLVLSGKIPLEQAPKEMSQHPVMLIDLYCKGVLAERRAKIKVLKPFIPKYLYWDDTPDPPSGLSIESGHVLRMNNERLCIPPEVFLTCTEENVEDRASAEAMNSDKFEQMRMKYESDLIKELRLCETVEQMYVLADKILGIPEEEKVITSNSEMEEDTES